MQQAGGWLFDQVMAGWDVTVITVDSSDPRPLRILGVRAGVLDAVLALAAADVAQEPAADPEVFRRGEIRRTGSHRSRLRDLDRR